MALSLRLFPGIFRTPDTYVYLANSQKKVKCYSATSKARTRLRSLYCQWASRQGTLSWWHFTTTLVFPLSNKLNCPHNTTALYKEVRPDTNYSGDWVPLECGEPFSTHSLTLLWNQPFFILWSAGEAAPHQLTGRGWTDWSGRPDLCWVPFWACGGCGKAVKTTKSKITKNIKSIPAYIDIFVYILYILITFSIK